MQQETASQFIHIVSKYRNYHMRYFDTIDIVSYRIEYRKKTKTKTRTKKTENIEYRIERERKNDLQHWGATRTELV